MLKRVVGTKEKKKNEQRKGKHRFEGVISLSLFVDFEARMYDDEEEKKHRDVTEADHVGWQGHVDQRPLSNAVHWARSGQSGSNVCLRFFILCVFFFFMHRVKSSL